MEIGALSPTKVEQAMLCESRLAGRLNQLEGEDAWDEEFGESAATGTLAHCAAKLWYRPNAAWLKRVKAGEDPAKLAAQAQAIRQKIADQRPPAADETDEQKAEREADIRRAMDATEESIIAPQGLLKHPFTNPSHVFRKAIDDCAQGPFGNQLPHEADSVGDARSLFETIIAHYNRDNVNVVFAERRYKGKIANGVPIHTILDLAIDRGEGRLEVVDYKTGWITCTTEEMYGKHQVLMNLLAVARYDESLSRYRSFSFSYFWVQPGFETGPVSFSIERLIDYEHFLATFFAYARNLKEPRESTNRFCISCGRRFSCRAFRALLGEAMGHLKVLSEDDARKLTDDEVMVQHDRLGAQIKLLEGSKKTLSGYLMRKMQAADQKQLRGEAFKATIRQNRMDNYDPATVLSMCAVHRIDPAQVVSVTKKKVEEFFGSNTDAMRTMAMTMRRGATAPFLDIRPANKKEEDGG